MDANQLGWDPNTAIELDHNLLKAPHVKLRSITAGSHGDYVYCVDLRVSKPNVETLTQTEMHSFEHFLLEGFRRYMPETFISVGLMGCQTGFYLVFLNEGHAGVICKVLEDILTDILAAHAVPYANDEQCGNYQNHSLEQAQNLATRLLQSRDKWSQVI